MNAVAPGPWKGAMKSRKGASQESESNVAATSLAAACFEIRVEPIWRGYREQEMQMGYFERRRARRRTSAIVSGVNDWLTATRVEPGNWHRPDGERLAHLRVARMGLVRVLKKYVQIKAEPGTLGACLHLGALRDRGCLILPPDFRLPFPLSAAKKERPLWVLSAPRLRSELSRLKEILHVSDSPGAPGQADFVDAQAEEIQSYESRRGTDDEFWARFTAALLVKAVDRSLGHELPAIVP